MVKSMLGMTLVTHQTGPEGKLVNKVYVEAASNIKKEYYLSFVTDRATEKNVIIASPEGGVDIEKVAEETPEKLLTQPIDPVVGIQPFHIRKIGYFLGFDKGQVKQLGPLIQGMYNLFVETDCSLVEVNPLIVTDKDEVKALDAKINFDDNAEFRHKEYKDLRDESEENPVETQARAVGLNYVDLDGNIGCMVNGAGLAMATMDLIKQSGGEPANFLDVGGTADADRVEVAFNLILQDPKVKAVLVNIFGGIVRCDRVANGIVQAYKNIKDKIKVPIIVRLEGTNAEEAKDIIDNSGLKIFSASSFFNVTEIIKEVLS